MIHHVNSPVAEDILDLAHGHYRQPPAVESIQNGIPKGRDGIVPAVFRAGILSGGAGKGPGDDPAHQVVPHQHLPGDLTNAVQLLQRDNALMSGYLKDAVCGGINDGLAGFDMLIAQPLDDLCAGSYTVAQSTPADLLFKRLHDLFGEAMRISLKRMGLYQSCDLPVSGSRVLSGGMFHKAPVNAFRMCHFQTSACRVFDVSHTHLLQIRDLKLRTVIQNMSQRIRTLVPILCSIRHLADAQAVKYDNNGSSNHKYHPCFLICSGMHCRKSSEIS